MPSGKRKKMSPPKHWSDELRQEVDDWLAICVAATAEPLRVARLKVKLANIPMHQNELRYWRNAAAALNWVRAHLMHVARKPKQRKKDAPTEA